MMERIIKEKEGRIDSRIFLSFIKEVKKSNIPSCPVSPREEDSSLYTIPENDMVLLSMSN